MDCYTIKTEHSDLVVSFVFYDVNNKIFASMSYELYEINKDKLIKYCRNICMNDLVNSLFLFDNKSFIKQHNNEIIFDNIKSRFIINMNKNPNILKNVILDFTLNLYNIKYQDLIN
jgi:hypothetical protein